MKGYKALLNGIYGSFVEAHAAPSLILREKVRSAVCFSGLQFVALPWVAACCSVSQCVAECCCVLLRVAVCRSVSQCVVVY